MRSHRRRPPGRRRRCLRRRRRSPARPPPADQVHPRWRARPVRRAAGPPGGRRPRPAARCRAVADHVAARALRLACATPRCTPIKATDVTIGSVFHVMPEGTRPAGARPRGEGQGRRSADASRPRRHQGPQGSATGATTGIVAYSKICTHVGCPVGLYEQQTHHLLCPCHQSTFDVTRGLQGDLRAGQAAAPAAEDHCRRRGLPGRQTRLSMKPSARASGSVDEHRKHSERRADWPAHRRRDSRRPPTARSPGPPVAWPGGSTTAPARRSRSSYLLKKVFPDHWSFMLGEIAMYSLVICLLTGHLPDVLVRAERRARSSYDGSYVPLKGVIMSEAYGSTLNISFDVRGRPDHPPDPPLGGAAVHRVDHRCTCSGCSSPARSASRARSTG